MRVGVSTPELMATPAYEGALKAGDWARVRAAQDCLDFRVNATDEGYSPINFCQPTGFQGYVANGPMLNEGRWWWWIAGQGWAQDEYLAFVRTEDLSKRTVPELSGLAQLAYIGADGGLWLMNADGSSRKHLVDVQNNSTPSEYFGISVPQWRPDGQQLLFNVSSRGQDGDKFSVRIVNKDGASVSEIPNATSAFWSPDGTRLGLLHGITSTGLGSVEATPSVYNIDTGLLTSIGPHLFYGGGPKWRSNGEELVYENEQGLALARADGSDIRTLMPAASRGGKLPNWSPDGSSLSLQGYSQECQGYIVYHVKTQSVSLCAPESPRDSTRGGRGGWSEDGQTDWSPDGRFFAYHTEWGVVNESGVYVVDATTAEQTLLPSWSAAFMSFAPHSRHVVFETHGGSRNFIWIGDAVTGVVTLLGEGSQPASRPIID